MASGGSVIPLFQKMLAEGATSLPITDPRMTRFWITLPVAVDFVASCTEHMAGGEIFIPKIPSMKITELAEAIAPDVSHRMVGIRPGEKLHEVMITEDDARHTVELSDRYIIQPSFGYWTRPAEDASAQPVAENFRYSSDNNPQWIDAATLRTLISQQKA